MSLLGTTVDPKICPNFIFILILSLILSLDFKFDYTWFFAHSYPLNLNFHYYCFTSILYFILYYIFYFIILFYYFILLFFLSFSFPLIFFPLSLTYPNLPLYPYVKRPMLQLFLSFPHYFIFFFFFLHNLSVVFPPCFLHLCFLPSIFSSFVVAPTPPKLRTSSHTHFQRHPSHPHDPHSLSHILPFFF